MAGGPGSNSRGRGGKFKKYTRGGGKHFSRDLRPLDADGNEVSIWSEDAQKQLRKVGNNEDLSSEEESSEKESDEGDAPASSAALTREERKKTKKEKKNTAVTKASGRAVQVGDLPPSESGSDSDDIDTPANPNHSKAARTQARTAAPVEVDDAAEGLKKMKVGATPSRRERESLDAQQAKERYQKMHEAGKTDQAKADLARLKLVREKREAEEAQRKAEEEERISLEKVKRSEIEAKEAKKREAAMGPKPKKGKK